MASQVVVPQPEANSAPAPPASVPEPEPTTASAAVNAAIDDDFNSTVQSFNAQSQDDDEYEYTELPRANFVRTAAVAASAAAVTLLIAAVALAKSPKTRALLTFLACTAPTAAMPIRSGAQCQVHASVYSRSQAFISGGAPRENGIMDSGTTKCTSGRKKLFPAERDPW